ncbi:hypothetical protein [Dyella terrae]|uniref:hypothetical protein n=1 Tax=Dyella terrae TaxID=522259 RepID=UPI001EFD2D06|nr:hypothetical protein [Dyella terrae]ULU26655.1 hypothetical protein DYST_03601 [Dyella terrae]
MRLYRASALLLAAMSAASCSTLGFHQKDADAPTQVALSLYAAPNVNPNPDTLPPDTAASAMQTPEMTAVTVDTQAKEGPYLVNLAGTSKAELAEKMKALLDYLQSPDEGKPTPQISLQVTHAADTSGTVSRAAPVATSTDTGAVASVVHTAAATTAAVAPYVPGMPAVVGKMASGVASLAPATAPAVSASSPKADALALKAEPPHYAWWRDADHGRAGSTSSGRRGACQSPRSWPVR